MSRKQYSAILEKTTSFQQLKQIAHSLLPKSKTELFLFFILLGIYLSYSFLFVLNSSVVDLPFKKYDIIFIFDNIYFIHDGTAAADIHPLLRYIMYPMQFCAKFASRFGYKCMGGTMVVFFSSFVAMGVMYVYRYLKEIVKLDKYPLWLLTCMYASFFTNLILCFIVETYTLSVCLLAFTVFFYSLCIKQNLQVEPLSTLTFTFLLGGITVTNGLKGIIPYLFTKGEMKQKLKNSIVVGLLFVVSMLLLIWSFYGDELGHYIEIRLSFSYPEYRPHVVHYYESVIDFFLGSPIFSSSVIGELSSSTRFDILIPPPIDKEVLIVQDYFRYFWEYVWVAVFYAMILFAILKNRKNIFVQMLIAMWAVDVFMHIVLQYGIDEAFIYGGHWIFLMPMFLAWGYQSVKDRHKQIFLVIISLLFLTMLVNNINELHNTYLAAVKFYPPVYP